MNTQGRNTEVLQVELQISWNAYRSLVAELRQDGPIRPNSRTPSKDVKALIDIDISRRTFSVQSIAKHRLPRPVAIRTDSETHNNLARVIFQSLETTTDPEVSAAIKRIILSCPDIALTSLRINPQDLELSSHQSGLPTTATLLPRLIGSVAPTILLDLDETPTLIITETPLNETSQALTRLRDGFTLVSAPRAQVVDNFVEIFAPVSVPQDIGLPVTFFAHWGSYDDLSPAWQDEQLPCLESLTNTQTTSLYFRTHVPSRGSYGATFFAQVSGSPERIWLGRCGSDDAKFYIHCDDLQLQQARSSLLNATYHEARTLLSEGIQNPKQLSLVTQQLQEIAPSLSLAALLEELLSQEKHEEHALTEILRNLPDQTARALRATYGIGEIIFATPEGPQAAAGGLAQVINGLPPQLCASGIPVSIITPLYRYENGNKHRDAETVLYEGITIQNQKVKPQFIGSVTVQLGPTYYHGTSWTRRPASVLPFKVYLAQLGNLRVFLLANNSVFDRVYQPVHADEQLRRAIALSRAVLETIITPHFGIKPTAIISNDWMTACIPSFCALDQRYQSHASLQNCKTIHMIHNGGADYHGRIPCPAQQEDLWPMFNLAPEHYFGFRDPYNRDLLNFTIGAARHATGGVLTVSRPYAEQISSPGGGDGLEHVLKERAEHVFGISNGIDRAQITSYLSMLSGEHKETLCDPRGLLQAKNKARELVQARYGLTVDGNATLISLVGRLAEQKGLHLLSGLVHGSAHSTLERLLLSDQRVQLIVAGPLTSGDLASDAIRDALAYLCHKYPGRVSALFDYIPHPTALEIIFASTLFLMPSRFEPGGITQLEALAAGTLVVGRNVGGISATIENFNPDCRTGNGFLCNDYCPTAFANTALWALETLKDQPLYEQLVSQALNAPHAWSDRAPIFIAVLQRALMGQERFNRLSITDGNQALVRTASARV